MEGQMSRVTDWIAIIINQNKINHSWRTSILCKSVKDVLAQNILQYDIDKLGWNK